MIPLTQLSSGRKAESDLRGFIEKDKKPNSSDSSFRQSISAGVEGIYLRTLLLVVCSGK